jgi:hypothetical protein
MPTKATTHPAGINVPNLSFSLAGFQVTLIGRFWVTPEARSPRTRLLRSFAYRPPKSTAILCVSFPPLNREKIQKGCVKCPAVEGFFEGEKRTDNRCDCFERQD